MFDPDNWYVWSTVYGDVCMTHTVCQLTESIDDVVGKVYASFIMQGIKNHKCPGSSNGNQ